MSYDRRRYVWSRGVTSVYIWGWFVKGLSCENLPLNFFLVTVVDQMVLGLVSCNVKIHCTAAIPCKMANLQG